MVKSKYTQFHKKKNLGLEYDEGLYSKDTWSNRIWQIEKEIIKKILKGKEKSKILDFATGTGRVLKFLEENNFNHLVGIDSSSEMLKQAKRKLKKKTKLFCLDISEKKDFNKIKKERFDIIIAFRFFLNAEKDLREDILDKLKTILKKDGFLIFNIHKNKKSFIFFIKKLLNGFSKEKINVVSFKEVKKWVSKKGLKIQNCYTYGFIPHKKKIPILPYKIWYKIEKKLISEKSTKGSHLLVICKKIGRGNESD